MKDRGGKTRTKPLAATANMMRIVAVIILMGFVACTEETPAKNAPDSLAGRPTQPAALWIFPGGEGPKMRLEFEPHGQARFSGGYEFLNPVRWSYDSSAQVLTLRMNGIDKGASLAFEDGVARGYALGFNRADSALMLRLGSKTTVLWIAGYNFERMPDTVSAVVPRGVTNTPPPSPDSLPLGYTLTDTTNWQTMMEDGQRAILRRGGVAIDTVDLNFGVAAVGVDSLVFLPVRTDTVPITTTTPPWYESYPREHVFWTPTSRREFRELLPFFNAYFSSPTIPLESVIHYWGIQPHKPTNRLYAMRYNFRTAHLDSLFLNREDPLATDYRYHLGTPQVDSNEVSFGGVVVVDKTTWRVIRQNPPSN